MKKNETIRNLKLAYKYSKGKRYLLIFYIIATIALCLIGALVPIISAKGLIYMTGSLWKELLRAAIILTIVEISRNVFFYLNHYCGNVFFRRTLIDIDMDIANEILNLETKELDNHPSGIFIDRIQKDASDIADIFNQIISALANIVTNIGIYIAIFIINKYMFILFTFGSLVILYFKKMRLKSYFDRDKVYRKINDENTGLMNEFVRGIRDIKVLNCKTEFLDKLKTRLIKSNDEKLKMRSISRKYELITGTISDLLSFSFIILGIILATNSALSISNFVILYNYQYRVYSILDYYFQMMEFIKQFNVSCNRVFELLDDKAYKKECFGRSHINKAQGNFEFKNVNFSYDKKMPILKNVSFKIKANETVAFVGKSGAGKSTIFSLLTKLYPVKNGQIYIDGIDINKLDRHSIRNNISIITQDPYIFNFSIKDNLKLVNPNMTNKEMIEACKMASIDGYINTLPHKYNTIVGEGGITLSGGQRQRIAIARALLKKTEIILFDEATSALDNETQEHITKAINNMKGEYTILIIAHRLSTIKNCNRIIFMDDGKIIDSGSHNYLLNKNKDYKLLYDAEIIAGNKKNS